MKLGREFASRKATPLLFACLAFLTLPLAAQQEVSPEHFDQKPSPARSHKPAVTAHKATAAKNKQSASNQGSTAPKDKSKAQAPSVLKADAATSPNSR